ncbi:ComEA family DNA-binding protein [Polynucleobacter rarus]|jgi:competence ComEA-like helix-hairpin-helix protein|uniref:ComEA family DNA-binding protein n=1 Tax=Polynucleobacter rarus TaxID=556055 RepID=UPI000D3E38F8|nr:helix-hairpin-helix domain-containing protein [Polynucleobacter rarus]
MKFTNRNLFIANSHQSVKKILISIGLTLAIAMVPHVFAESINTVSQEVLQNIKGVGASKAKKIISERQQGGNFQSASDLRQRVKGVGEKTLSKMDQAGITFTEAAQVRDAKEAEPAIANSEKRIRSRSRKTE